jgi:predicted Zn-dependent protease
VSCRLAGAGQSLRGRLHLSRCEPIDAIQAFQKVLKLEPGLVPAGYQLAQAQLQAGNLRHAKAETRGDHNRADFVEAAFLSPS